MLRVASGAASSRAAAASSSSYVAHPSASRPPHELRRLGGRCRGRRAGQLALELVEHDEPLGQGGERAGRLVVRASQLVSRARVEPLERRRHVHDLHPHRREAGDLRRPDRPSRDGRGRADEGELREAAGRPCGAGLRARMETSRPTPAAPNHSQRELGGPVSASMRPMEPPTPATTAPPVTSVFSVLTRVRWRATSRRFAATALWCSRASALLEARGPLPVTARKESTRSMPRDTRCSMSAASSAGSRRPWSPYYGTTHEAPDVSSPSSWPP